MATTVWYRNNEQGSIHEVEAGSALAKRLQKEQREFYEDGDVTPSFEPAYTRLSDAEVRKLLDNPEKIPGYQPERAAARAERLAEVRRKVARDEAMDALIIGQAQSAGGGPSEADVQARIDSAVQAAVEAALAEANKAEAPAAPTPKGK